jgi:PKD repeat protein
VGTHPYLYGDVVTLAASASTGSTFTGWSSDADCVDSSVMMDADKACTATFTLNTYTLTVATDGTGSGVVTPTVGTHPYLYGDPVSLAATANTGSTFAGWSGDADCIDSSVTMDGDKACTATFTLNAPAGLSASNDGPTALGSVTTLTATITDGLNVTYAWNFGDGSLGASAAVTHTYAAAGTYTAIVTATNSAGSLAATTTVYVTTNPIAHAGSDQTVHTGRSVTLDGSASFDPGNFLPLTYHWQQTGGSAVTLSDASNVTATFAAPVVTQTRTLTFELTITNAQSLASSPDVVVITVEPYRVMLPLVMR